MPVVARAAAARAHRLMLLFVQQREVQLWAKKASGAGGEEKANEIARTINEWESRCDQVEKKIRAAKTLDAIERCESDVSALESESRK